MKISQATRETVSKLWANLEPRIREAGALEEAAQLLAGAVHESFGDSTVIARVFVTVPYADLPPKNQDFVKKLAKSAKAEKELKPSTPVLSLVGTHGQEPDWNDRRNSKGHVGIPLISSGFVAAIPMISRLLKEMGVPIEWVDTHEAQVIVNTIGSTAGVFFVEDAAEAVDREGRKIIAAQDFVSKYHIKSVFGTGGAYPGGQMVVMVVFCRDELVKADAERFLELLNLFKAGTMKLSEPSSVFAKAA